MRIKICGITNIEDAQAAVELGADALGFVFAPSPRQVTPQQAKEIIEKLPPFVATVGVFTDESPERIRQIADECKLDYIQLHGAKPIKILKKDILAGILVDTKEHDWESAIDAKKYSKPVILAGSLTPENVAEAIKKVKPYAVDVSSGIESSPGKKDYEKMKRFIDAAR